MVLQHLVTSFVVVLVLFVWSVGTVISGESRVWKDTSGKFSVEAELMEQDGGMVRLKKSNGKTIRVAIEKLCPEDQEYPAELAANPFQEEEENANNTNSEEGDDTVDSSESDTTVTGSTTSPRSAVTNGMKIDEIGATLSTGDWSENQTLIAGGNETWQYQPVIADPVLPTLTSNVVSLVSDRRFAQEFAFNEEKLLVTSGQEPRAIYGFRTGDLLSGKDYIEWCDLTTGKATLLSIPFQLTLCDCSPDGKTALVIHEYKPASGGFNEKTIVSLLDLSSGKPVLLDEFLPYRAPIKEGAKPQFPRPFEGKVDGACWADTEHIFTGRQKKTTLWARNGWKAIYTVNTPIETLVLSPDKKYFASATAGHIGIRQVSDGTLLGTLQAEGAVQGLAFSPQGDRLAAVTENAIEIYSLTEGRKVKQIATASVLGPDNPVWTGESSIMLGTILYDLDRGIPLCNYYNTSIMRGFYTAAYRQVWLVLSQGYSDNRITGLIHLTLPHQEAVQQLNEADLSKNFALSPDAKLSVKLDLNGLVDEAEVQKIINHKIKECGFTIDETSKVQLTLCFRDSGEEEEISYGTQESRFPIPPPPMLGNRNELGRIKLKVFIQEAVIKEGDKTLWDFKDLTTGPRSVEYDPDKKIEDVFRETNIPTLDFVKFLPLPRYLSRSSEGAAALTTAEIGFDGIKSE